MDSSAVRCACSDVSPNVTPSTTTTSSVAARKTFAVRPSRTDLIPLASGIRGVVFAVLVLVPDPQRVRPGRHVLEYEAPVPARLGVIARRHHLDERDHAGVDVAEDAHQP